MQLYQLFQVLKTIDIVLNDATDFVAPYTFYHNSDNDVPIRWTDWSDWVDWNWTFWEYHQVVVIYACQS